MSKYAAFDALVNECKKNEPLVNFQPFIMTTEYLYKILEIGWRKDQDHISLDFLIDRHGNTVTMIPENVFDATNYRFIFIKFIVKGEKGTEDTILNPKLTD